MPGLLDGRRRPRVAALGISLTLGLCIAPTQAAAAPAATEATTLQISFDTAASVRLRGQRFVGSQSADLAAVNDVIQRHPQARVERVFRASEASLDAKRGRLLGRGHRSVPDLNRHYRVTAQDGAERDALLAALRPLPVVDEAVIAPRPAPSPVTPSFAAAQRYGTAGPVGIDVAAFAGLPGGRGEQVKIVDIEYSWNSDHEDLPGARAPGALIANGTPQDPFPEDRGDHGTAVLGELIGADNAVGITGLAPSSEIAMVNAASAGACGGACWTLPDAVSIAHQSMSPGDVMLIEQQFQGNGASGDYVPVEYWPAVYDAIRVATQDGIVVIEAAGNASSGFGVDLDAAAYGSSFPDGKPDSGAIIVGAGSGDCSLPANGRLGYSAHGSRVNLQGWGQCVTTSGYGDHYDGGSANSRYTQTFSGTSSASPMVAAAAALYSSVHQATRGTAPAPELVRSRLVATGTPQAAGSAGSIGPLPNLRAVAADFDTTAPAVTSTAPAGGASGVPVSSALTVGFSEPMDQASAEAAFSLVALGTTNPVAGSFSWSGQTMTFRPSSSLSPGRQYLAEVGTGARDLAGNALASSALWQFATDAVAAASSNLVANPSFETDMSGWGGLSATLTRVAASDAPAGGWVARVRRASGASYSVSDNAGTAPTVASVTAGTTYIASCHVRAAGAQASGRPIHIVLRERVGSTGTIVKDTLVKSTLSTAFKRLSVSAVAVTTGNTLGMRCEQTSAVSGDAFDADLMTLVPAATVGGDASVGTIWTNASANVKRVSALTLDAPREITSLHAYVDGAAAAKGSQPVTAILYAGTASGPTSRIATSAAQTISAGRAAGWLGLTFAAPVQLAAGTYWIGLHTGSATVMRFAAGPAADGALRFNSDTYSGGATTTFGSSSTDSKSLSLYAVGA